MPESLRSKFLRLRYNLYPAYRRTGARVIYVADTLKEVRIKLPLNWKTRNHMGSIFGGSIYACIDPVYCIMIITNLGKNYVSWSRSATIRFIRPARTTLYATFLLGRDELMEIQTRVHANTKADRTYCISLIDENGVVFATVEEVIHIRLRKGTTKKNTL